MLSIAPEEAMALLLDNAPAHPDAEKLVSVDGKSRTMPLPPNATSIMQTMDLGVIVSCNRFYQRKYQYEVLLVIEEEEDTRGQRTLSNIKNYNIKSASYNIASAWNYVKMTTLSNSWKKLMLDEDLDLDFDGLEPNDFHQALLRAGEIEVSVEDVEDWLVENDSDPGYQLLSTEEIAESVLAGDQPGESSSSDSEDEVVVRQKMSQVSDCSDTLIQYADVFKKM